MVFLVVNGKCSRSFMLTQYLSWRQCRIKSHEPQLILEAQ